MAKLRRDVSRQFPQTFASFVNASEEGNIADGRQAQALLVPGFSVASSTELPGVRREVHFFRRSGASARSRTKETGATLPSLSEAEALCCVTAGAWRRVLACDGCPIVIGACCRGD